MSIAIFLASKLHLLIVAGAIGVTVLSPALIRVRVVTLALVAIPLAYALGEVASLAHYLPRPFVELGVAPLISHVADNGFPSSHTLFAMTIALVVFTYSRQAGVILIALAVLVGVGRVLVYVHSPSDVLVGMLLAFAAVTISYFSITKLRMAGFVELVDILRLVGR